MMCYVSVGLSMWGFAFFYPVHTLLVKLDFVKVWVTTVHRCAAQNRERWELATEIHGALSL